MTRLKTDGGGGEIVCGHTRRRRVAARCAAIRRGCRWAAVVTVAWRSAHNQMECDDLDIKVDLPVLGLTDVLPFPGELVLGDVCIDRRAVA